MSYYPFLAEQAEKDEVFKYLKLKGVDVEWNLQSNNFGTVWNEISFEGKVIMQIDQGITVDYFKSIMRVLANNFYASSEELPDNGAEVLINISEERKDEFIEFCKTFKDIFNE